MAEGREGCRRLVQRPHRAVREGPSGRQDRVREDRGGHYAPTLTTLFASGSPPDIVHVAGFDYPRFAGNSWLENLDPYIEKSKLDLKGWSGQERCKWKGETVCIVNLYFGFTLGYNEELLQKAGVAVPKNYAEFLAAAKKLTVDTNGDGIIDQYGTGHEIGDGVSWYVTEMLNYMLPRGAFWTNSAGKITMDTPQMVAALTDWKEVNLSGAIPRDPKGGDTRALFAEGKLALKVDGPWLYPILNAAKPNIRPHLKLTTSPFSPPVGGISNVLAMAADISDKKKQLVWDFIMLATSDQYQSLLASSATRCPQPARRPRDGDEGKARPYDPDGGRARREQGRRRPHPDGPRDPATTRWREWSWRKSSA